MEVTFFRHGRFVEGPLVAGCSVKGILSTRGPAPFYPDIYTLLCLTSKGHFLPGDPLYQETLITRGSFVPGNAL